MFYNALLHLKSSNFRKHCALPFKTLTLVRKYLSLKKGARDFHVDVFWKDLNSLIMSWKDV